MERNHKIMKKWIAILLCMLMAAAAVACDVKVELTESSAAGSEQETDAQPEAEPGFPETLVGGWTVAENTALTEEQKAIFDKALETLIGVNYVPVALLGTQVVAGTNYCFLAQATVVYPDAAPQYKLVYVYADLEGNAAVLNIVDMPVVPNEDGTVTVPAAETLPGGWSYESDPAITDEVKADLEKALENLVGATYEPVANLASQVVNGMNRCILCKVSPVVPEPAAHYALVYVYTSADGSESSIRTIDFNLDMPETEPDAQAPVDEQDDTTEPIPSDEDKDAEAGFPEALAGGWAVAESTALTEEQKAIFDKALEALVGADYVPAALLGTQVVAGTNYCFLAQATVVYPDAAPQYKLVYVYEDLEGNAAVLNIADMPVIPDEYGTAEPIPAEETLDGGWTYESDPAITEEIGAALSKALEGLVGATYEPVADLATQVVAGTNRCILCKVSPVVQNPSAHYALVYVYEALDGSAELLQVIDFDFGALCTYGE